MDAHDSPPDLLKLLSSVEEARRRLRREIARGKRLLRRTNEYIEQLDGNILRSLVPHLPLNCRLT